MTTHPALEAIRRYEVGRSADHQLWPVIDRKITLTVELVGPTYAEAQAECDCLNALAFLEEVRGELPSGKLVGDLSRTQMEDPDYVWRAMIDKLKEEIG